MLSLDDIKVGHLYRDVDDPSRTVRVTRIWTTDRGALAAFDIFGTDLRGRNETTHSAISLVLFAQRYGLP